MEYALIGAFLSAPLRLKSGSQTAELQGRRSVLRHYKGSELDGGAGGLAGGFGFGSEVGGYAVDDFVQWGLWAEGG
jgi:hypothetical protein